jgi:hypothetical protein
MLDKDESGMVEFPEFARVMAKRAEVEAIKKKTQEFRDALKVSLQQQALSLIYPKH